MDRSSSVRWHDVDGDGSELLARRIRLIPVMIIAGHLCFFVVDPWLNATVLGRLTAVKIGIIAVQLAGLRLLRGPIAPSRTVPIGVLCVAAGALGGAWSGAITRDPFTTPLLSVAGMLITAAVVPWRARVQAVAAALAVAAGAATVVLVSGLPAAGYPAVALTFVAGVSVYVTFELDRQRAAEANARSLLQRHQAELAHVLRLGAMGEMAAQLAHELTQPLGAIANYAAGCRHRLLASAAPADDVVAAVDRIGAEALRAGEIIRRIRGFVQKAEPKRAPTDLNALVRDVIALVGAEARASHVAVHLDLDGGLRPVDVDAVQIEQVLINLVRNGLESLRETAGDSRALAITTRDSGGRGIEVAVSDSGAGLRAAEPTELFEPFYTTKEGGLGMGLAISRAIIEAHGGRVWVEPNATRGVTFRFTLPR